MFENKAMSAIFGLIRKGVKSMKKILVAHDGSDAADKALLKAVEMAKVDGAAVTVISVVPNLCFTEIGVDCKTVNDLYRAEVEGLMEGVREILKDEGVSAEIVIVEGRPADEIADYAMSNHADLIVIGSTGKQSSEGVKLGSVSSSVVDNAVCSVLVVR